MAWFNYHVILFFSVSLLVLNTRALTKSKAVEKREILDQILPKNPNDILVAPVNQTDLTIVQISAHIFGIDKIDDEKMEFTLRLWLKEMWQDDRLYYDHIKGDIKQITINDPDIIWTPGIYFRNEKKAREHDITHVNAYVRLFPNGTVMSVRKLTVTASCPMNLKRFPFDNQVCVIEIGAIGSSTEDLSLFWKNDPGVTIGRGVHVPVFSLLMVTTNYANSGNVLIANLLFSRNLNYYLIHTFIPCAMLVITSWIPFWLDKKFLTARLLISLAALFTASIIIYDQNKSEAKLSYSTYKDCFTGTCLTLIFISLIESVIVHGVKERGVTANETTLLRDAPKELGRMDTIKKYISQKMSLDAKSIDVCARILIPIVYLIFCMVYFVSGTRNDD